MMYEGENRDGADLSVSIQICIHKTKKKIIAKFLKSHIRCLIETCNSPEHQYRKTVTVLNNESIAFCSLFFKVKVASWMEVCELWLLSYGDKTKCTKTKHVDSLCQEEVPGKWALSPALCVHFQLTAFSCSNGLVLGGCYLGPEH